MFASKDNSIINEPLMARHARFMHAKAGKLFRAKYMTEFNQAHAAAILRPSHERRAMDVESAQSGAIIRELFIEEARRQINMILVRRFSKVLFVFYALVATGAVLSYGALWSRTEEMRIAYVQDRGYQSLTKREVITRAVKNKAADAKEGAKEKALATKDKLQAFMKARADRKEAERAASGAAPDNETLQPTKTEELKERAKDWFGAKKEQLQEVKKEYQQAGEKTGQEAPAK